MMRDDDYLPPCTPLFGSDLAYFILEVLECCSEAVIVGEDCIFLDAVEFGVVLVFGYHLACESAPETGSDDTGVFLGQVEWDVDTVVILHYEKFLFFEFAVDLVLDSSCSE